MDMDLKPPTQPKYQLKETPPPGATPPEPQMDDPFKVDPPPPELTVPKPKKKRSGKAKKALLVILVLALLGAAGYGIYYWQHQQVDKLAKENQALTAQLAAANKKASDAEAENAKLSEAATPPTADTLVITAATADCQAEVDPATKKALVYTQGTQGTDKKKVLYSTDKTFAKVSATCAATANATEPATLYYAKLAGTTWTVIYADTAEPDADVTALYAIPTEFK